MSHTPDIRAIVFDIGGVLVQYDHTPVWREFARRAGRPDEEVRDLLYRSSLAIAYETGRIDSEAFVHRVTEALDLMIDPDTFRTLWSDIFAPMPGMDDLVGALAVRYPLLLASNTNRMHFSWLRERFPVVAIPQWPVLSYEVGAMKPDRRFYEAVLQRSAVPSSACLYVDDVPAYVEAGRGVGMRAVQFEGVDRLRETCRMLKLLS